MMMTVPGTFIALEGVDGSGKGTQFKLLAERLRAVGYDVEVFDFPRYDQPSSHFVRRYLNGDYGPASGISPYSASMFYALDRFEAAPEIRKALEAGKIVLSNRYVGSNMAHQGSKFTNEAEQRGFFIWADSLEYQLLGIPRPNLNIFLRVPAEVSFELIAQKAKREYTEKKRDEHEADIDHLRKSLATYDTLCRLFPKDFFAIECTKDDKLMSIPAISDLIWRTIQPLLPAEPQGKPRDGVVKLDAEPPTTQPKPTKISLLGLIDLAKAGKIGLKNLHMDWTDPKGIYSFYTPSNLDEKTRESYLAAMQQLADSQRQMRLKANKFVNGLESKANPDRKKRQLEEALAMIIPLGAHASVELPTEPEAISTSHLAELKTLTGQSIGRKSKLAASQDDLSNLVRDKLPAGLSTEMEPLTLLEAWPRNEFEILSDGLYGFSDLPRQDVQAAVDAWTYDQKYQALTKILQNSDAHTASQVRYRWDVIADQKLLLELLADGLARNIQLQASTPRYGYDVPGVLGEAALEDDFINCFDASLSLFSVLQSSKDSAVSAYAVLLGHKVRFQFTSDLASLLLAKNSQSLAVDGFYNKLVDKIYETHPLIGAFLSEKKPASAATNKASSGKKRRNSHPK